MDEMLPKNISIIEDKGKFTDNDPGFLVAKGRFRGRNKRTISKLRSEHIDKLRIAAFASLINNGYANIRAIGPNAKSNAVDACEQVMRLCEDKGIQICLVLKRETGNLGPLRSGKHVQNVEAMVFQVYDYKEWKNNFNQINQENNNE